MKPIVHCTYAAFGSIKAGKYKPSSGRHDYKILLCGAIRETESRSIEDATDFTSLNNKFFFDKELFDKRPMVTCPECIKIIKEAGF